MTRRFITVEDIERARGGSLEVEEGTVVTPQALDAAAAAGVSLVGSGGAGYVEPPVDRGPDAARAQHTLPALPEPGLDEGAEGRVIVLAVGANRPGVLSEITSALAGLGANVGEISQRVVDQYFHLVLTVELSQGFEEAKRCLECLGGESDYTVRVMHSRVFHFMHRV